MRNKNAISLVLVLVAGLLIGGVLVKYITPPCASGVSSNGSSTVPASVAATEKNGDGQSTDADIAYATFSSPKADFTFEYPDTWVYDENEFNGTVGWRFYSKSADKHDGVPYLEIQSPVIDPGAVGFSNGAPNLEKGESLRPYHNSIYVFSTNDPSTFVTYQWGGREKLENGSGYIYWEKGQYFVNSSSLSGHNYNYMRVYPTPEGGQEIGLHIAQSIKLK